MDKKYTLSYRREATSYLRRLEKKVFDKITFQLLKIAMWFEEGLDIARMKWFDESMYRLKIGNLRIIYQKQDDVMVILVIKIWPRGDVYK